MTKDLEETLAELGPGYRAVVERVQDAYRVRERSRKEVEGDNGCLDRGHVIRWGLGYLVAASLLILLGLGIFFTEPTVRGTSDSRIIYTVAYMTDDASRDSIVRDQRADGSWANDFLTRQNAAALRNATDEEGRIAYKKAVRYLRAKGLRPLSEDELKARGDEAARRTART